MIVSANNKDIPAPARVSRQKRQKCTYINAYGPISANPTVFYKFLFAHFFLHQYNRYQREIQEENGK